MTSIRKKFLPLAAGMGLLASALIFAAATCDNTSTGTDSVFSVTDPNGTVGTDGAGGSCNVQFWNVTQINTKNIDLPTASGQPGCADRTSGKAVVSSNSIVTPPDYGDFEAIPATTENISYQDNSKASHDKPAGNYNSAYIGAKSTVNFLGSSKIKTLTCSANNSDGGFVFAPGVYYIDTMYHSAGCNLDVMRDNNGNPVGKVTLHFNTTTTLRGEGTFININPSTRSVANSYKTPAELAKQHPEMLQIVVHNGDLETQKIVIAAGIYVKNGKATIGNGSGTTLIGEVIAKSITFQNNTDSIFYYKSTAGTGQRIVKGFSTIATTAIPSVVDVSSTQGGNYAYIASQKLDDDSKLSGHLLAYAVDSTANISSTAAWDAADKMTVNQRRDKLVTNLDTASGSSFTSIISDKVPSTPLGAAAPDSTRSNKNLIINPSDYNGAYLGARTSGSLIGRPWRTAPIIARTKDYKVNLVVFASDDGVLYGLDAATGELKWGWVPKDILPLTAKPADLMSTHPWGQLAYVESNSKSFITGTALHGALHFSLKLQDDGTLDSIVWYDYAENQQSPTVGTEIPLIGSSKEVTSNQVGATPGGEAPIPAITQNATTAGLVAYIRGAKVYMRRVDSGDTPIINGAQVQENINSTNADGSITTSTALPSTNLIFVNSSKMAFGDTLGHIKWFNPSKVDADGKVSFESSVAVTQNSSKLLGITATTNYLPEAQEMTLIAYDKENVNTVKWMSSGQLLLGWHIGISGSDSGLPKLPSTAILSAVSNVYRDRVFIPFTIPPDGTTNCDPVGYTMGPLDLNTGKTKTDKEYTFNDAAILSSDYISKFGTGEMLSLRNIAIKVGNNPPTKEYTVGLATYGGDKASTGWGKYDGEALTTTLKRILWREVTNY